MKIKNTTGTIWYMQPDRKTEDLYVCGQVDTLFDIAMDMAKRKYYHKEKWDPQKVIDCHLNFCLGRLGHTLSDIDYELWCMMALIMGVKQ